MPTKNAAATAYIRELCALGLSSELFIPALLEAMHRVIPSARNLFDWVDAEGSIRRYYFEGPIDHAIARLYFDEFYNRREAEAMPKYADVIRGGTSIRSADELNHPQFFESALYHEIWRPQRLHFRLEAVVRGADVKPLGSLVLYREKGDRIFERADEQKLATLLPYIARALASGRGGAVDYAQHDRRAAQVNLDSGGRIVHLSRNAHKVLLLAHGDIAPGVSASAPESGDFPTLGILHRQVLRMVEPGASPCALSLTNAWGRFDFRAERLDAVDASQGSLVGVTIHHLVPREVRDLNAIESLPLSIAQKKVCSLLVKGWSQPQIAKRLGVSPSTVTDHVRKIYGKLDVHCADDLRARFALSTDERA